MLPGIVKILYHEQSFMSSQAAVLARPFLPSEQLRQIQDALASKPHVSLFLDFDGTISPITAHPEDATLDPGVLKQLIALSARTDFSVAIISGRQLDDVRRVGLDHLTYAGNHGLEIESAGTSSVIRMPKTPGANCAAFICSYSWR